MTTGHWNPGYNDTISRHKRVKSAVPHGQMAGALPSMTMLDNATLDDIKEHAKDIWLTPDRAKTSYNDHFKERILDISDITTARPTSAGRRNKPHPSDVFLVTHQHTVPGYGRLNEIPGYHNPDTTLGKNAYTLDGSCDQSEQQRRTALREKYVGRPSTAIVNQYKTDAELEQIKDPVERQGFEAWLKLASKDEKQGFLSSLHTFKSDDKVNFYGAPAPSYRPKTVPSLHRYLRHAGAAETENVENMKNLYKYPHTDVHSNYGNDLVSRKLSDIDKTKKVRVRGSTKRGDFLMHPEWTPTMAHHRLNGLSSVDLPYFPGKR